MKPPQSALIEQESSLTLAEEIVEAALEAKGNDIVVLEVREVFDIADYFVIVSGRSDRQTQGINNRIIDTMKKRGIKPAYVEGYEEGHWIILDFTDVVVHVFYEPKRAQYDLEGLWVRAKKLPLPAESSKRKLESVPKAI